ncbi:MAG: helix-turn-helix transcriptional regulator [Novipirellula sp. JB048]
MTKGTGPALTDRALDETLPGWGVLVLESHHSARFTMPWRSHRFVKILYVLKGRGTLCVQSSAPPPTETWQPATAFPFAAGDVIVVRGGDRNRIIDDPASASSLYVGCIATELLRFDPCMEASLRSACYRREPHLANRVASRLRRMAHRQNREDATRPIAMVSDAMQLIQWIVERQNSGEQEVAKPVSSTSLRQQVQRYVAELQTQFYEATTIEAAARRLGIPRRSFTKLFAEITGTTWLAHVRRLAIEHAKLRLRDSEIPIVSIAFECGFNDLSTFYRQFKRQVGCSPSAYRQRAS